MRRGVVNRNLTIQLALLLQTPLGPYRHFGNQWIGIFRGALDNWYMAAVATVADCNQRVSADAGVFGAFYRRASELLAKFFFRDFCQPRQHRIDESFARFKLQLIG